MPFEELKQNYADAVHHLIEERDELKLQIHLFNMDAKDQWQIAEEKWLQVRQKSRQIGREVSSSGDKVKGSIEDLLSEISEAYDRLKTLF